MNYLQFSEKNFKKEPRPVRILQFGEGNFLRAFADSFVQTLNETRGFNGNIAVVKPTSRGNFNKFTDQNCMYTVMIRGVSGGQILEETQVVDSIEEVFSPYTDYERFLSYAHAEDLELIISNTTEAGIVFDEKDTFDSHPAATFPGKLTQFLYERFCHFGGSENSGLILLPVELIDNNGDMLKDCVLRFARTWELPSAFLSWVENACTFCNTLVDRIVSGFPAADAEEFFEKLGYEDQLLTVAEPFGLWVIEADEKVRGKILPGCEDLPILFTDNHKPFKERKVRILNGAHTSFAMLAFLCGKDYVRQAMDDPEIYQFIETVLYREVMPCLSLPEEELTSFAEAVLERFRNPFLQHALLSISLNSVSKWRARCMPSLLAYEKAFGKLPACLTFSLAALLCFYCGSRRTSDGLEYTVKDDAEVLEFFQTHQTAAAETLVQNYLARTDFHGQDLNQVPGLTAEVTAHLQTIRKLGIRQALSELLNREYCNE